MLKQGGFKFWNARENQILGLQKTASRSESDCGDIEKNKFKKQRVFQHNRPKADNEPSFNSVAIITSALASANRN